MKNRLYLQSKTDIPMKEDSYMYNSVTVARFIAASMNERKLAINMTKLQKLLYIAYGTCLNVTGKRLTDEHPQAWPYGPVFPTTRNRLLKECLSEISLSDNRLSEIREDWSMQSLVKIVIDAYGGMYATTLSEWSHRKGSPWYETVHSPGFKWGNVIPDILISEYFSKIVKKQ